MVLHAQDIADKFNRANSNTVGGGWGETETGAAGAAVDGSELRLQEPSNNAGREFVSQATPGSYSTTLNQNNCVLTWAFNMRQTRTDPSGFDASNYGVAVVLAGSASDLTTGQGYAVVLGQSGGTDAIRLVRYNGGLDLNSNLTNIVSASDFGANYLDVRVTYTPSTDTWQLFYRDNGANVLFGQQASWSNPLTASTSAGSAVDATYTGTALGQIGVLWNHGNVDGDFARVDNFYVPSGRPSLPVITPSSATICNGGSVGLSAASTSTSLTRVTVNSSGGPATVTGGPVNATIYPWTTAVSGLPTSGVTLESVTINGVGHTYPDDIDILLQSPTGTNVILMSDAGDADDITGRTFTFMDGSPAATDNPPFGSTLASGLYAPTNYGTPDDWPTAPGPGSFTQTTPLLSLFTGNLNGDWDLLIRDDAGGDNGTFGSWSLTFTYTSTVSYTWTPATGLSSTTTAATTASPTSTQVYTVTAAHSANACTQSANVTVTVVDPPTTATVGGPQTVCELGTTTGLGGNTPGVGTGAWSVVSGGSGTFSNNTDPDATFTHTGGAGPVVVRWTISTSAPCPPSTADVSITITPAPTTATVGGSQTVCENGTTAGLGGNTPVNGTGAWSVVSGGTGSFSNAADPNATFTHAAGAGPVVVRWTISNAPCTPSTADVSITITPSPTTSAAGSDQSICNQPGTATMAANAPGIGTGLWSQVSGPAATITTPASPTTTITGMTTPGSYVFRWTISNAPCTASEDDVTITTAVCAYYSRATGNVTDPIWSDTPTGTAGAATFGSAVSMVVQSPDVVTNDANTTVNDLTVDAGGELVLAASVFLAADGDAVDINGDLTADDNSLLVLSPSVASTFDLASATSLWDLTIDADVSTTLTGALSIRGSLDLLDGDFDCTANQVTLASGAGYTGRLGPVAATADYLGNMRIERYRPAGLTNWMLLGSPISSRNVVHWQDDFITAGYPGSQFPNFDDPVGSNILWPSVRWYDETDPGAGNDDGMQGVSSNLQPLSAGQGFAVWAGSGLVNTTAFTIDLQNNVPVIASTPVTLPMSYTNTGNASVDGWNLVSNPLPSPIAFDQIVRGADVGDFVTFYNPANGNTAVWDISLNAGTNGGTNTIQSMQGFFLKATGSLVTTTVDESAKVNDNAGGMFGLTGEPAAHLRLRIASDLNTFSDEAIVVFSEGQPALDADDAEKFVLAHDSAPQIATLSDGIQLAMNAYGNADAGASLPLRVNVGVTGEHTISAIEVGGLELSCLAIEDLETGAMVSLLGGQGYTFTMDAAADPAIARFILHINNGPVASFTADNSTVTVGQPVQFTAAGTTGSYAWSFGDGNQSTEQNPQHAYAAAGSYTVTLTTDDGVCSSSAIGEVTVELSTSVAAASKAEHRAWAAPQGIVVEHAFTGKAAVTVELLDATGRIAYTGRMNANRQVLPSAQLANGAWFVRLDNGSERVTLRVPLAR
jgi:subtilisin-like proprotein convertase family protein